jgi:hypothetical protein
VISVTPWRTLATFGSGFGSGRDPIWNENGWEYPNCIGVHLLLRQPVSIPKVAKWFRKFGQLRRT